MGKRKSGIFRIKIEYEDTPIIDNRVHGMKEFDETIKKVKRKMK